ncbi:MAG: preprotein translocase subunit YajC [Planctomycetota bacterium]|nr:MAG: preprotein translocase subunit YajC [Planctomycetota bacterium]
MLAQAGGGGDAAPENLAAPEGPDAPGGFWIQFFANPLNLLLLSGILFIFLVLRPQQKQMREHQARLAGLKKNDRVVTSGGIHGTVVQVSSEEPTVTLRIDENSGARMTVNKDAITKVLTPDDKDKSKK